MDLEGLIIKLTMDTKDAKKEVSKVGVAFKELTGYSLSAVGAMTAAGTAIYATARYFVEANQEAIEYNNSMMDMSRVTGMTYQEVQLLSRAGDDARISQEALQKAMELANKNGYATSIASLQQMAEEYASLNSEVDKAKFLTERFGKSGQELGKLFQGGSAGLKAMIDEAKKLPTLTDAQSASLEQERLALGAVADAWEAMKLQAGAATADTVTGIANVAAEIMTADAQVFQFQTTFKTLREQGVIYGQEAARVWADVRTGAMTAAEGLAYLNQKAAESGISVETLATKEETAKTKATDLKSALDKLNEIDPKFASKINAELERIDWMKAGGDQVQAFVEQAEQMFAAGTINLDEFNTALETAYVWETQIAIQQGTITEWEGYKDIRDKLGLSTMAEAKKKLEEINAERNKFSDKTAIFTVVHREMSWQEWANQNRLTWSDIDHAAGGSFTIPNGFANDSYPLGFGHFAQSGETVTVTPANKTPEPAVVTIDERQLARSIAEAFILSGVS